MKIFLMIIIMQGTIKDRVSFEEPISDKGTIKHRVSFEEFISDRGYIKEYMQFLPSTTPTGSYLLGMIFFNKSDSSFYINDKTGWVKLGGGGGGVGGSGSPSQVAFWTSSNTIGGNNNLWWDNTNARLGIGTSSPAFKLDVKTHDTICARFTSSSNKSILKISNGYTVYPRSSKLFFDLADISFGLIFERDITIQGFKDKFYFYNKTNPIMVFDINERRVGIGTNNPQSRLHVAGSISLPVKTVNMDYTATDSDYMILVDASGGVRTITLPVVAGRVYVVKKIDSSVNAVYVIPASGTIDGASSHTLLSQWKCISVICDGTDYYIISSY
uniref:Uncharacterized protein n=1 Tax=candidate division WOR-3 bacterium TaxID=2052148 RepID=A0A7V3ZTT4_UNCW3